MPSLTTSLRWMTPGHGLPVALGHDERRAAAGGDRVDDRADLGGDVAAAVAHPRGDHGRPRPCGSGGRRPRSTPAHPGLGGERHEARAWRARPRSARAGRARLARTTIERPSGVSSARLDSWAASASSPRRRRRPGGARRPGGCRRVIVPVLSSSRVVTSPAASTARPDIASTLRCTSRSMPAMPIADSSAPIVVGIRQTSSATSTTIDCGGPGVDRERLQRRRRPRGR